MVLWALHYAKRGLYVLPCNGKTPLTEHAYKDASIDEDQILAWWMQWPEANIGIATGQSKLFVVDIDDGEGKAGGDNWERLKQEHGSDGAPVVVHSGGGGRHGYYRLPESAAGIKQPTIAENVDTRVGTGYVIAPPSVHPTTGRAYAWADGVGVRLEFQDPPEWIVNLAREKTARKPELCSAEFPAPVELHKLTRADLEGLARRSDPESKRVAQCIIEGESTGKGARATTMFRFLGILGRRVVAEHGKLLDPDVGDLFDGYLHAVNEEGVTSLTDRGWIAEMIWKDHAEAWNLGCADREAWEEERRARDEHQRGLVTPEEVEELRAHVSNLDARQRQAKVLGALPGLRVIDGGASQGFDGLLAQEREGRIKRAFRSNRKDVYSSEELKDLTPPEDFGGGKFWIVDSKAGHFVRGPHDYEGPFNERQVPTVARDLLAPAASAGVRTDHVSDTGTARAKTLRELMHEYGTAVSKLAFDYRVEKSTLSPGVFIHKAAGRRKLAPHYDPEIARWLELLGGEYHGPLLDWLATFLELERPTAALVLRAPPGIGKNMLVLGLARLFESGHVTSFPDALANFNGQLRESPIVFADEGVRVPERSNMKAPDELRIMVDSTERQIVDKNKDAVPLRGAFRVVLATNSKGVLHIDRNLTQDDVSALNQRVLLLQPNAACAEYLKQVGGRSHTDGWVAGDGIARHVLWLVRERGPKVVRGDRFLVSGQGGFSTMLAADGRGTGVICRAVLRAMTAFSGLSDAVLVNPHGKPAGVWFHTNSVRSNWASLLPKEEPLEDFEGALNVVCVASSSTSIMRNGLQRKYRQLQTDVLRRVASQEGLSEELEAALSATTQPG